MQLPVGVVLGLRQDHALACYQLRRGRVLGGQRHFHRDDQRLPVVMHDLASRRYFVGIQLQRLAHPRQDRDVFLCFPEVLLPLLLQPAIDDALAVFIEEMERLARAQTARGVPFDEGGAITRARRIGRLLVPIFISGFARADTLTVAMNTRSYRGGRRRTKLRQMSASTSDWLALALVTLWVVVAWMV